MNKIVRAAIGGVAACVILLSVIAPSFAAADASASVDPHANETKAQRDRRMHWWREAKFGMFIHWGLYAVPGGLWGGKSGYGEWIMNSAKIPVDEYAKLAQKFNPTRFNADNWVGVAKAAGMKYIVMTAKHHEGFAMFHTSTDGYNIYDATPFKRDPIAEMTAAARRHRLKFGVYYSQAQDWHHPGGAAYGGHWDKAQDGDIHEYVRTIAAPQVKELLTKYRPSILWWDTSVAMSEDDIRSLTSSFGQLHGLIANNRLGNGVPGDTQTPEQNIPAKGYPGKDWETCMTINDHWGYCASDHNFKSPAVLLHNLVDIASKGGNYLLNVGPDATGTIPQPEVDALLSVGNWLKVNGKSIYGTTATPLAKLPANERMTVKGDRLYLHVFDWSPGVVLPGLATDVKSARILNRGAWLAVSKTPDGVSSIAAPAHPDLLDTVVELRLKGPLQVYEIPLGPQADGSIVLNADDADLHGRLMVEHEPSNIGYWIDRADSVNWSVRAPNGGGRYKVSVVYACDKGVGGSVVSLSAGKGSDVRLTVEDTGAWDSYRTVDLPGELFLPGGNTPITLSAVSMPHGAVMNLRKITLTPVPISANR